MQQSMVTNISFEDLNIVTNITTNDTDENLERKLPFQASNSCCVAQPECPFRWFSFTNPEEKQ